MGGHAVTGIGWRVALGAEDVKARLRTPSALLWRHGLRVWSASHGTSGWRH